MTATLATPDAMIEPNPEPSPSPEQSVQPVQREGAAAAPESHGAPATVASTPGKKKEGKDKHPKREHAVGSMTRVAGGELDAAHGRAEAPSKASAASVAAEAARTRRKQRAERLARALLLWVVLPTALAAVYFGSIAQSRFESVAVVALRGTDSEQSASMLKQYIASRAMLSVLEKQEHFSAHYKKGRDVFTRLPTKAGSESSFAFFREQVEVEHEQHSEALTLRVRAFDGKTANNLAKAVLAASDSFIKKKVGVARKGGLTRAREQLDASRQKVLDLERKLGEVASARPAQKLAAPSIDERVATVERDLALREFEASLASFERMNELEASTSLVVIAPPSKPSEAAYPRRLRGVVTAFVVSLVLFGIMSLLVAAVREHGQF